MMISTRSLPRLSFALFGFIVAQPANAKSYAILHDFVPPTGLPDAPLAVDATGNLFGTYSLPSSPNTAGAVYELTAPKKKSGARTFHRVHVFHVNGRDGEFPNFGVLVGPDGNLFGMTPMGGTKQNGTIFELIPQKARGAQWQEKILHNFTSGEDGGAPDAPLVLGPDGAIYGSTEIGGGTQGWGNIFKLVTNDKGAYTLQILFTFPGGAAGVIPTGALAFDAAGDIYGTTLSGGDNNSGTAFELSPAEDGTFTETVLHSFGPSADGVNPRAGLTMDPSGNLFGATQAGGSGGEGVAYELSPSANGGGWTYTILHAFGGNDGGLPNSELPLLDSAGNLLGTTTTGGRHGGGTIWKLTAPQNGKAWTKSVLHSFAGSPDGNAPLAGLTADIDGSLVGTTEMGGIDVGTIFRIVP
jgi:uncharacterized repeat protein (TIGR03803 family)